MLSSVISRFQVTPRGWVTHVIIFPVIMPLSIISSGGLPISVTVPVIFPEASAFRSMMMAWPPPPPPRPPRAPGSAGGAFFCASSAAGTLSVCHFPVRLACPKTAMEATNMNAITTRALPFIFILLPMSFLTGSIS